jgi:hypothetical protein
MSKLSQSGRRSLGSSRLSQSQGNDDEFTPMDQKIVNLAESKSDVRTTAPLSMSQGT